MNIAIVKQMKEEYYEPWNQIDHITDFGIRLDEEQKHLAANKIAISEEDMLHFYIDQRCM